MKTNKELMQLGGEFATLLLGKESVNTLVWKYCQNAYIEGYTQGQLDELSAQIDDVKCHTRVGITDRMIKSLQIMKENAVKFVELKKGFNEYTTKDAGDNQTNCSGKEGRKECY